MKRICLLLILNTVIAFNQAFSQVAPLGGGYTISAILGDSGEVYSSGAAGGLASSTFIKVLKGEQPNNTTPYLHRIETIYSGAGNHILAKDCDGGVYAWGGGGDGQLGNGGTAASSTPVRVRTGMQASVSGFLENVNYISTGNLSSYALLNDGSVMAWGNNGNGRLGDGTTIQRTTPVWVKTDAATNLTNCIQICGMENSAAALRADGTVWVWGANSKNECSNVGASSFAGMVTGLPKIVKIATGDFNVLALDEDGYLWNWGSNEGGMFGDGVAGGNNGTPRRVLAVGETAPTTNYLTGVMDMVAGQTVAMAVLTDGSVVTWGADGYGQQGRGGGSATNVPSYVRNPANTGNLSDIVYIGAGDNHCLAMKADGTLYTWGWNGDGQLGLGNTTNRNLPVEVTPKPYNIKLPCPVARLGPDVVLCNPIATELYSGSQSPTYAYEWYKDGILISNNDDNYAIGPFLWINTPGTYKVVISDTSVVYNCNQCIPSEDEIVITTNSVAPINAEFCTPPDKQVTLGVSSALSTFNWYAAATGGTPLTGGSATNSFLTPLISGTTTYYVEDTRTFPYAIGYSHLGGDGLGAAQHGWSLNDPQWMRFFVEKTLTLTSVDVFKNTACGGTIAATIRLANITTGVNTDYTQNINCSGLTTFALNAILTPGEYRLHWVTGMGDIRSYPGATYPRGVTGLLTLNKILVAGAVFSSSFFNWQITAPSSCARIPVQAIRTTDCPAPVELLSFTGKKIDAASHLFWSTAQEKNSSHFEVERSDDGINFKTLGSITSNGNTINESQYSFIDHDPNFSGAMYYRLRMVDMDGTYEYSKVIFLDAPNDPFSFISVYPNPIDKGSQLNITALSANDAEVSVKIYDLTGKIVYEAFYEIKKGHNVLSVGIENISKGMYMLHIQSDPGYQKILKVVVH